ncbi:MAG: TA system VapC family ribonuclease toxin [Planctomycetota bacterium]
MIAVDTNILVYAHRRDSANHDVASDVIKRLAEGRAAWAVPWPCLHEFLAIVTHPKIYAPPSTSAAALDQVQAWLESPSLVLLTEGEHYWARLREVVERGRVQGPRIHDARIAAICIHHGVRELWTADRDFTRFVGLRTHNPLVG